MPPRKRARHNTTTTTRESTTPARESPAESESPNYLPSRYSEYTEALSSAQHDPWTDEEETLLFKSLVRWKPTGIHKHFRMLSIFEEFRTHGYISSTRGPPAHLRIPGIWAKLYTLYDLDALDQRENAHAGYSDDDSSSEDEDDENAKMSEDKADEEEDSPEPPRDFVLPDEDVADPMDFGELMWKRRILEKPDEQFSGPELVKGLSRTRTLPGAKLGGVDVETGGTEDEEGEDAEEDIEEKEQSDDENDEAEDEEEEGDENGDEEEDNSDESAETEDEEERNEEEGEDGGEEDESADELAEDNRESSSTTKAGARSTAARGRLKTTGKQEPPRRRGTRRR